jgi:hypothetical protein
MNSTPHHDPLAIYGLLTEDDLRDDDDPILDSLPARRSQVDADRLLRILDELEKEAAQ